MSKSTTIIGVSGASGAGKSRFANLLHKNLRREHSRHDINILNEDCYYRDRSDLSYEDRCLINYDHPDALEHQLLVEHLTDLQAGKSIQVPQYDYAQHNRKPETVTMEPTMILILEGILILHDPLVRDMMDLKIFVDVPMDVCLSRRLKRDVNERGRSMDAVLTQYEETVRPMFFKYIDPSKSHADLIIPRGGENLIALAVLQSHLQQILV